MAEERSQGIGKCPQGHLGSFGYPTRPGEPYQYCPQCGLPMVWACGQCASPVPEDPQELATAHFCRACGAPYFGERPAAMPET